jgi:hypothetical protein
MFEFASRNAEQLTGWAIPTSRTNRRDLKWRAPPAPSERFLPNPHRNELMHFSAKLALLTNSKGGSP